MKEIKQVLIALALSLAIPVTVLAVSPPTIPLLVYGEASINGQPAPVGAEISAEIDGKKVANVNITDAGRYFIEVPDGKVNENEMITFKVNGIANSLQLQCVNIDTIPSINFNLAVTTVSPTPPPASGGGGGAPVTVSQTSKKGDITGDGKVDKYDFSLMMANWGKTGPNDCDLNNDNKVDKYDFALLMLNWNA